MIYAKGECSQGWSLCRGLAKAIESGHVGLGRDEIVVQRFMLLKEALRFRSREPNPCPGSFSLPFVMVLRSWSLQIRGELVCFGERLLDEGREQ